jgi:2'-5' RNA ligase
MVGLKHDSADNRTSLVIVALPSENDPVQKVSSEKAAHMTLLYLGEPNFDQTRIDLISGFVEHAASTLSPFMLDVERRGELGPDKADVLFFVKRYAKRIATFRDQLLQNDLISQAYNSIEQYPEWTPHLTLGYPTTPAQKSPSEDSGIWYVNFDRISLWTGDSTGPTFQLLPNDSDMEVAMSQTQRGRAFITGASLNHYGVKGMHWGVRKAESSGGSSAPTPKSAPKPRVSADAKAVENAFGKINRGGTDALSNHELQGLVTRLNLEQQYERLTSSPSAQQKNALDQGHSAVKQMLGIGKTINDVHKFMNSPAGKALKGAFGVVKVGAAAYTGGASGAAAAGASLAVRRMSNHYTNVGR